MARKLSSRNKRSRASNSGGRGRRTKRNQQRTPHQQTDRGELNREQRSMMEDEAE